VGARSAQAVGAALSPERREKVGPELFQMAGELLAGFIVVGLVDRMAAKLMGATTPFSRPSQHLPNILRAASLMAFAAILATPNSVKAAEDMRVALVIGNGAYINAPRLDNPVFDARAVAGAFRKLGFHVVDGYDLDIAQMRAKISEFSADLPDAKSAVIYYAGHGISVDDENYIVPTDIVLKSPTDLDLGAISVSLLLKQMKREDRVNIVILDACRDNPFATELAKHNTRAIVGERGLSRIDGDLARGTLIAFASDPKSTALDGAAGQHSPFTNAFLDHVYDSGVSIDTVMSRVRTEVWDKTRHIQLPWVNTSLIGDYTLNPQPSAEQGADAAKAPAETPGRASAADSRQTQENLLWESAQHSNLSADYQAYLDAFPNGIFAQMAKNRIANLAAAASAPLVRVEQSPALTQAPQKDATNEPAEPSGKDWKAEIGTAETEKALKLTPAEQKEIQQRLIALDIYKGPETGVLDTATRSAFVDWQESRGVTPTSFLGSMQLTELRVESDSAYQKYLAALSAPREAPKQTVRPALRKVSPKQATGETTRKVKAPGRNRTASPSNPSAPPPAAAANDMLPAKKWIDRRYDAWQWVDH
jgi:uncharacterized caspase-like protein